MRKKLLLFDLDGTLLDSRNSIVTQLNRAIVDTGLTPRDSKIICRALGNGSKYLV